MCKSSIALIGTVSGNDDAYPSKAVRLGFSMRRSCWVTIQHRFAAAQRVKVQKIAKKRYGVRDTSQVERRSFCSTAQWAANCAVEDASFYCFSMRGARAEGEYRSVGYAPRLSTVMIPWAARARSAKYGAAAFSLRRSRLVCN